MTGLAWTSIEDLERKLLKEVERVFPDHVLSLKVELEGDVFMIAGEVSSEQCKSTVHRKILGFERVFKVENGLQVTAFLEPADGHEPAEGHEPAGGRMTRSAEGDAVLAERGAPRPRRAPVRSRSRIGSSGPPRRRRGGSRAPEDVVRRPVIDLVGDLAPGQRIEIVVDLPAYDAAHPDERVSLGSHAPGWGTLIIAVKLASAELEDISVTVEPVTVNEDGSSSPARFEATVRADATGPEIRVDAAFFHGTRFSGSTSRAFALATTEDQAAAPSQWPADSIVVAPTSPGPTLAITIAKVGDRQLWTWASSHPTATGARVAQVDVGDDPELFAKSLLQACPEWQSDEHRDRMRSIGERLWELAPPAFTATYLELRSKLATPFPIQFILDDPWIPWELMLSPDQSVGMDHLYLSHPVARWPARSGGHLVAEIPRGRIVTFAPEYADGEELPGAQRERDLMISRFGAEDGGSTRAEFLALLKSKTQSPVSLIHFAGHGQADSGARDAGVHMADRPVTVDDVDHSAIELGRRHRTLVVLNACEMGSQGRQLGLVSGWGSAIANQRFGGLIAPLWEIEDDTALQLIETTLDQLLSSGAKFGSALQAGRVATCEVSVSGFAYIAHGDVMAKIV